MKSKIFVFISILILVGLLFCVESCKNNLLENQATININLDLSKIVKTSRNDTSQNTEYVLKLFAYDASTYKTGDEIENIALLSQTENKVGINGQVKASLDIEIGLNVIFVGKLYEVGSEKPIYSGNSEVVKIKATDNKVDLVLSKEKIYLEEYEHICKWSSDETYHWKVCACGKTEDKAEHSYTDGICECGMREMVLIPAGTFQMGTEKGYGDDKPVHEVTITKSFYMRKYEVTQAEYEKYCSYGSSSPSSSYGDGDNYPAYYVSWYDALVYCNKRSMAEGLTPCYSISGNTDPSKWGTVPTSSDSTWNAVVCDWNANGYRLPTEAEWEYAARAGDNTVSSLTYAGTNSSSKLGEYAWYSDNSSSKTHEVGTKKANAFGLYDMSGNVWEWCWNWFTNNYNTGTEGGSDPTGASSGDYRVYRGGGWGSNSGSCAVSYRNRSIPYSRNDDLGFRVVRASSN
jgi:formylglycine-generating enzyme required for sulfatase activity